MALQRRQALKLLRALDWESWLRLAQVRHEMEQAERKEASAPVAPLDVEQERAEWLKVRKWLMQQHRRERGTPQRKARTPRRRDRA